MYPFPTLMPCLFTSLSTAYLLDPSTLHPPGTPMTQYTPSGSILHPSPPYSPWLTTPRDSDRDSPQPAWYRPHPHAAYHNTTHQLSHSSPPQSFSPKVSEFDDPKYIYAFLDDVEKEQEKEWWRSLTDDLDSLPRGAKICLVIAGILFAYLFLDAAAGTLAGWLDSAEASEKRKKQRGRRIVRPWWERYSFIGAVGRWGEMTRVQMGINEGGPNSLFPAQQAIEMPMMRRSGETTAITGRDETVRTEQHVPYTPEEAARMMAEINQLPAYQEVPPPRRLFGGMPGSPLWFANQARRAFRGRG